MYYLGATEQPDGSHASSLEQERTMKNATHVCNIPHLGWKILNLGNTSFAAKLFR